SLLYSSVIFMFRRLFRLLFLFHFPRRTIAQKCWKSNATDPPLMRPLRLHFGKRTAAQGSDQQERQEQEQEHERRRIAPL
ncbi:hypothetical protein KR038_003149, partial [Drosophila bunnanda]